MGDGFHLFLGAMVHHNHPENSSMIGGCFESCWIASLGSGTREPRFQVHLEPPLDMIKLISKFPNDFSNDFSLAHLLGISNIRKKESRLIACCLE